MKLTVHAMILTCLLMTGITSSSYSRESKEIISYKKKLDSLSGKQKVLVLTDLCYIYSFNNTDSSIYYGERALDLARQLNDSLLIAQCYNDLSIVYFNKGEYPATVELNKKALKIRLVHGSKTDIAASYSKIGNAYNEMGDYELALDHFLKSAATFEEAGNKHMLGYMYNNIGSLYRNLNEFKKAREYHEKAIDILKVVGDSMQLASAYGNLAICYEKTGQHEKSLQYNSKTLELLKDSSNLSYLATVLLNRGVVYRNMEQTEKGKEDYLRAFEIFDKLNDLKGMTLAMTNLGNIHLDNKEYNNALNNFDKALSYARLSGSWSSLVTVYRSYSDYYKTRGDYEKALSYNELKNQYDDSLFARELSEKVAEMQTKYETAKKEKELLKKSAALEQEQLKVEKRNQLLLSLSASAVLVIFVIFLLYRQESIKRKREARENELQQQLALSGFRQKIAKERIRIARDLHDHIGSQLTVIISSLDNLAYKFRESELGSTFDELSDFTRQSMEQLREAIWAMNKKEVSIKDVGNKVRSYITKLDRNVENMEIIMSSGSESEHQLSPVAALNIFRIAQEAVNNALKYAETDKIEVGFELRESILLLTVKDGGKGFPVDEKFESGNGLPNMKHRAEEIGGRLSVVSSKQEGTLVKMELPVNIG